MSLVGTRPPTVDEYEQYPVLVHPVYGISSRGNRRFEDGESQVGEFYKNQRKYKLNEMTGYGRLTSEKKVSYK